jgi:cytochrome c biogenesis protein CcmG/thiol:disulfide interchange protein DsbE
LRYDKLSRNDCESNVPAESGPLSHRRLWGIIIACILLLGLLGLLGFSLIRAYQGPIGIGDEVPDFILTTFSGEQIVIGDLRGQVVVINFWASWCIPCEHEAPLFEQAYQMYKDHGVAFLGVNFADTEREARAYLEKYGITYPNGPDLGTRISQAFRTSGVPETFIISPDNRLADVRIGPYTALIEIVEVLENVLGH